MAFETGDLGGLLDAVRKGGFSVLSGPLPCEAPVHGRVTSAVVRGPNGVLIEFFSK
jgi:hypothetical protein